MTPWSLLALPELMWQATDSSRKRTIFPTAGEEKEDGYEIDETQRARMDRNGYNGGDLWGDGVTS